MLKLKKIVKDYIMKDQEDVHALKGIDLNFRHNEFVAILGASGCGKTTLLNIIGGLDRYTSGDLIIEGKSTKKYSDYDWDTYRNHSIGFVFQSYNLIHHQTVLKNVELALTISGIKKEERRRRAIEALKTVGLEGMEKKKPNQLSGGQMQRVAIARALVNNPEILLADEPTGALDSETSIQIMDLLKEVSKNRLVIMVTHNPDLADAYATRIVRMSDGLIIGDSNPYDGSEKKNKEEINKGNKKHSSMSFPTALSLSLSNLVSKLKRTLLVAVAGSIGIIGVSSVLAVSFGVNNYIDTMQNDMMSQYPISITETTIDTASLMNGLSNWEKAKMVFDKQTQIGADEMLKYLMEKYADLTQVKTNEINYDLLRYLDQMPKEDVAAMHLHYGSDVTNNIFTTWKMGYEDGEEETFHSLNGLTQMYVSELMTVEGFGQYAAFVDLFTSFANEMIGDAEYIQEQYELVGGVGKYPTEANELLLVVDEEQLVTDLLLGQLGFYTQSEFLSIAQKAVEIQNNYKNYLDEKIDKTTYEANLAEIEEKYKDSYKSVFDVDEILNKEFKYYSHKTIWEYDPNPVFSARMSITIPAAIIQQDEDLKYILDFLLSYDNSNGEVLSGTFTINGNELTRSPISFNRVGTAGVDVKGQWSATIDSLETPIPISLNVINDEEFEYQISIFPKTSGSYTAAPGYVYSAQAKEEWNDENSMDMRIVGVVKKKENVNFGALRSGFYYTPQLTQKIITDSFESDLYKHPQYGLKAYIEKGEANLYDYNAYLTYNYSSFKDTDGDPSTSERVDGVKCIASAINSDPFDMTSMMGLDVSQTKTKVDVAASSLRTLTGIGAKISYDDDGEMNNPEFLAVPKQIDIYPVNFETKDRVTNYLDNWNNEVDITLPATEHFDEKVLTFEDRKELSYTDTIGMIVAVIDTLILSITIALISFTALSLVVSCFMIAVITYISTMERVKEIGVIRSLGGRKKDVSRLFIAETLIIGLASGLIGIGITYILSLILNICVSPLGVGNIAALPLYVAGIMVLLSIFLNVISGLVPSMKASHQDPVVALRSE